MVENSTYYSHIKERCRNPAHEPDVLRNRGFSLPHGLRFMPAHES